MIIYDQEKDDGIDVQALTSSCISYASHVEPCNQDFVIQSLKTDKAIANGVNPEQIIWDPGLGFAKTNEQNITLLKEIEEITSDIFPVLVGPSRKRFIGSVLNQPNPELRLWGTAAIACRCAKAKVSMLRVHDVSEISQTLLMANKIFN